MDKIRTGWRRDFFQAPNEIYDRRDISGYAKAVFVYLCRRADDDSRAFPAYARIAQDVGFSLSTVRRAIDTLTALGLLLKEARYDGRGFQTSNIYTLIRPSSVPEGEQDSPPQAKGAEETRDERTEREAMEQGVPPEHPGKTSWQGSSDRAGRVFLENRRGGPGDQPGCSGGAGRVSLENSEKDPDQEYPVEQDPVKKHPSVSQSVKMVGEPCREKRQTDGQTDFSDPEAVIKYYTTRSGATDRQVMLAMLSVQAQIDKGTVIMDYKAYFEKTLAQLIQEEDFRKHFV
ncbi:MAG: helix-turn-helix domain-containing protein [Bacillota bacterium]